MPFLALNLSLQAIEQVRQPLAAIRSRDADLFKQLRRAASSIPLNLSEGRRRRGQDRRHLYRVAAGSADELRVGLQVALAWQYLKAAEAAEVLSTLDRLQRMLWPLTR